MIKRGADVMRTLSKTWWVLALCGVLDLAHAAMNLLMLDQDGSLTLRRFAPMEIVADMSVLAVAAGVCVIAAGLWNSGREHSWLLSAHGLALAAFGAIGLSPLVRGPLSFRPISLLFVMMAASIGAFALRTAQTLRRGAVERWLLKAAGAASMGFALSFLAVGFKWVRVSGPFSFWIGMSSYFAFCAIFMLWLAWRVRGESVLPAGRIAPVTA
jgi:hypothetical protein